VQETVSDVTHFYLSPRIAMEYRDQKTVVLYHFDSCARIAISDALYRRLLNFTSPSTAAQAFGESPGQKAQEVLDMLHRKGFLLIEGESSPQNLQRRLGVSAYTMFHSPRQRPHSIASDVIFVGVPYDLGNAVSGGGRKAPGELRLRSNDYDYRLDAATGEPMGWYDVDAACRILQGVTISDWGDVWFQYGEDAERIFERVSDIAMQVYTSGALPVFLGGDHSISYPVIRGLQQNEKVFVVWLDGFTDTAPLLLDGRHNSTSVASAVLSLRNVEGMLQIGHRGYPLNDKVHVPGPRKCLTASSIREHGASVVLDNIPEDAVCYISVDISVLDPIYAPGCTCPLPGGFAPQEVKDILKLVGLNRRVIGLDLVEVNPVLDHGTSTTVCACQLLLAGLGAAMAGRRKHAERFVAKA
jgi:agmatinase